MGGLESQINAKFNKEDIFTLRWLRYLKVQWSLVNTDILMPIHFVEGGRWLDRVGLKRCSCHSITSRQVWSCVIKLYLEQTRYLGALRPEHGQIAEGALLPSSDWSKTLAWSRYYAQPWMKMGFNKVRMSREALEFLIHERHVRLWIVAYRCGHSSSRAWLTWIPLGTNIYQVEVLNNWTKKFQL